MSKKAWLGVDVGSISCKVVVIDENDRILGAIYRRTRGRVVDAVREELDTVGRAIGGRVIMGCGTTGSARRFVGALLGADVVINEITAHVRGALSLHPEMRTMIEIGGEDSKIVLLRGGVPVDFAMNTVCAAGTGAFLDQLASRLGIPINQLGELATASTEEVEIAGRCTVFAESDIIFKQQTGHSIEDILAGACRALVRNYLNDVGKGKPIVSPILFLGGVAGNIGIREAFTEALGAPVIVPEHYNVMGAFGAALVAKLEQRAASAMRSIEQIQASDFHVESFVCPHCENACEVVRFVEKGQGMGYLGGRCGRWQEEDAEAPIPVRAV